MRRRWLMGHYERVAARMFYYQLENGLKAEPRRYSIDSQIDAIWLP
jgi:hypothetical protein